MSAADYIEPLRRYIADRHLDGRADLEPDTPLLEWGVIDSFALADLLPFIDQQFGVEVPPDAITPDNFRDLESLASLVERLR
jgi:clorobiocin biosynthesis protein CloN5